MIFLFLICLLIFPYKSQAFRPERPVVLVHGIGVRGSATWKSVPIFKYFGIQRKGMVEFLVESGGYTLDKDLFIYNYDTKDPIEHIASEFRTALDLYLEKTNTNEVDLVCFSMGGLVARTALNGEVDPPVKNLITIGTPHKGSYWVNVAENVKPQADDWLFRILGDIRDNMDLKKVEEETYLLIDNIYRFGEFTSLKQMEPNGEFINKLSTFYLSPKVNVTCIAGYVLPTFDSTFIKISLVEAIDEHLGPGDLIVPLESALWERSKQNFVIKGRSELTWHSALPFHEDVQAIVKYLLSQDYMLTQLKRLD